MSKNVYAIAAVAATLLGGAAVLFTDVTLAVAAPVVAFVCTGIWALYERYEKGIVKDALESMTQKFVESEADRLEVHNASVLLSKELMKVTNQLQTEKLKSAELSDSAYAATSEVVVTEEVEAKPKAKRKPRK